MPSPRVITGAAVVVAAAGLIGTGAALSSAATTPTPSTSTSPSSPALPGGSGGSGGSGRGSAPDPSANPNNDTPVTGDELTKVTAAVKAEDSAVTVTSVRKDPDGSYDVFGTKSGSTVMLEVSKDLATVTTGGGRGPGGRPGGPGRGNDTPVTGDELASVTAAVKAKDSAVTVTSVQKDPDGSYDVFGTRAGSRVMLEVSKDLKTITTNTGGGPRA